MSKVALFTNYTDTEFVGYWDGKPRKFESGKSEYMPNYLAKHFAKHLTNRELLRKKEDGSPVYKDGEKFTSPKRPKDVSLYMELFNKAYTPDEGEQIGSDKDDVDSLIDSVNKNKESENKSSKSSEPQIVLPPDYEEDDDSEESFQGKPVNDSTKEPVGKSKK